MKTSTTILLSVLLVCQWAQAQENKAPMPVFYVSVDGADSGDGTEQRPFRTLERARAAVRKAKQKLMQKVTKLLGLDKTALAAKADLERVTPSLLRDGNAELHGNVDQSGLEDVPG